LAEPGGGGPERSGSRFGVWSGRGGTDAIEAVLAGRVDVALMTPTAAVGATLRGGGPQFADGAERLRALGTLPQRDRLMTCVDARLGVHSVEELAEHLPRLVIATSQDDGST
jgi:hypothetical protein